MTAPHSNAHHASATASVPHIEVVYALPREQIVKQVAWQEGMTVAQAIAEAHLSESHPEMVIADGKVGIFGKAVKLAQVVKASDRIEIYRPLINDPKELRRRKAMETEKSGKAS